MKVLIANDCHIAQTSYRKKKKKCEYQKSQEQQIFSHKQTVTEWTVNWEELSQSEERS